MGMCDCYITVVPNRIVPDKEADSDDSNRVYDSAGWSGRGGQLFEQANIQGATGNERRRSDSFSARIRMIRHPADAKLRRHLSGKAYWSNTSRHRPRVG